MTTMNNFVAVDWRAGHDRIYFFFKDTNTYSRFNLGDNKVPGGYPTTVVGNWDDFDKPAKDLRFGFSTNTGGWDGGYDYLWLFYYEGNTPTVCKYLQQTDVVHSKMPVAQSVWAPLLPYFDRIVGVMWNERTAYEETFWVLMNDGNYLIYETFTKSLKVRPLKDSPWSQLEQYKDRMMTAALNDYPTFDSYFYIFLTNNQYLRYEQGSKKVFGPITIDETSWPGLLRD